MPSQPFYQERRGPDRRQTERRPTPPPQSHPRPPQPSSTINSTPTVSLEQALKSGPVDFKGRKLDTTKEEKPAPPPEDKKENDLSGLRQALEEALQKKQ
jgi:hypothetical protein